MRLVLCLFVCALAGLGQADAANRTVCASGCQYRDLQAAIDAAVPGDVILLRAGETFTGNYVLRAKSGTSTAFITIRSDASDTSLPPEGRRLIPYGRPGANVSRTALPRLVGRGGSYRTTPIFTTEDGARYYRLQFLDIDGFANEGYGNLVALGANQTSLSATPHSLVLDRVYIHGHPTVGSRRGIALNSRSTDIVNSYISEIMHLQDSQAIGGWNGPGPFRILNNHLEATGENIMFGGADPKILNLVPSDIEIRGNYFFKPLSWRKPVLAVPGGLKGTAGSGGSLASGTHYFKVVAVLSSGGTDLVSAPSAAVAVTVGSNGSAALTWSAVAGAQRYRVYRGTSSDGQNVYVQTSGTATSLTYTGAGQIAGTPKANGTFWTVKNLLELKNARRVVIDGNLLEHNWVAAQDGTALLLSPRNQDGTAPWSVVRDITFRNNIVRKVAAAVRISGEDYTWPSQRTTNVSIANNVFEVDTAYGGSGRFLVLINAPTNITLDHNTIVNTGTIVLPDGAASSGFVFTNNMSKHNDYGIKGAGTAAGTATLTKYLPGAVVRGNVLAGGTASAYPAGNYFPTVATFNASFVNAAAGDYTLVASSPFKLAGTDGRDVGVNMTALSSARAAALSASTGSTGTTEPSAPAPIEPSSGSGSGVLPTGWQAQDIGATGVSGSSSETSGTFTIRGAGTDIWGTADGFHFAYQPLRGDGTIVARVASLSGTRDWTKIGVMIRASTDPRSIHASMFLTKSHGLAFQRRFTTGGTSTHVSGGAGTAPRWVRLARAANVITASVSTDGATWTVVGKDTFTMPQDVLIGLAATSLDTTLLATGVFDKVSITTGQTLPEGWESRDIGAVGPSGSASASGGTVTVRGAGADVWGTKDAFHYVYRTLTGDGSIVARVATVSGSDEWTKAGVMIRMTLDAGSPHAFMLASTENGMAFQRRTVAGGTSSHTSGGSGTAPRWVRLVRQGQVVTASVSSNGSTWTVVGQATLSITGPVHVGLAVTSHDASRLATATFDNVQVAGN